MSKSVLISIQPKWCELIANGEKTVEVRKSRTMLKTPFKVYIYCTSVKRMTLEQYVKLHRKTGGLIDEWQGKVIGEFVCDCIISHCEMANADIAEQQGRIKREELFEYSNGKELFGWHISDLVIYDKPKELNEFATKCNKNCETGCNDCEYYHFEAFESAMGVMECCRVDGLKPLKRPPQSWCYVKERE